MDPNRIIADFVMGRMTAEEFYKYLYSCDSLENVLMKETQLPSWTSNIAINLYHFLLEGEPNNERYMQDAKELLASYLEKVGVAFVQDNTSSANYEVLLKALPKWLDVPTDYFRETFSNTLMTPADKIAAIKEKIKKDFVYLRRPPRWLQTPDWPIEDGIPLMFIGELELGQEPGRARIYVFFSKQCRNYTVINQAN